MVTLFESWKGFCQANWEEQGGNFGYFHARWRVASRESVALNASRVATGSARHFFFAVRRPDDRLTAAPRLLPFMASSPPNSFLSTSYCLSRRSYEPWV